MATDNGTVHLWSFRDRSWKKLYKQNDADVLAIDFQPGGQILAACDGSGGLHIWRGRDGRYGQYAQPHE